MSERENDHILGMCSISDTSPFLFHHRTMNNQRQTDAKMSEEEEEKTPPLGYVLIDQLDCTHLYISLEQNIEVS